jgi:hypothetical protein
MPQPADGLVYDMAADKEGTLWLCAPRGPHWWDGQAWREARRADAAPGQASFPFGGWSQRFFGGGDRDLYTTCVTDRQHEGLLYKLEERQFVRVGTYYFDDHYCQAGLYVSRGGGVFNYTGRFVAALVGGQWVTAEVPLGKSHRDVTMLDRSPNGPVLFFSTREGVACAWDGKAFKVGEVPPGFPAKGEWTDMALAWGTDRVLLLKKGMLVEKGLWAARVGEGASAVDVKGVIEAVGPRGLIRSGWSAPDGCVWLAADPPHGERAKGAGCVLHRIGADGKVARFGGLDGEGRWLGAGWDIHPRSILQADDGAVWLGMARGGIARIADGQEALFGWREGFVSHGAYWLAKTPQGKLFACAIHSLYTWCEDKEPDPSLAREWEQVISVSARVVRDPIGGMWVFRADRPRQVSRWDGAAWTHFDLPVPSPRHPRDLLADDKGHLMFRCANYMDWELWLVGADGSRGFRAWEEAIGAAVAAGGRRFAFHGEQEERMAGPAASDDGRLWLHFAEGKLHLFSGGQRQEVPHPRVRAICLGEKGEPLFLDDAAIWTYRQGRLVDVSEEHPKVETLAFVPTGGASARPTFPYYKGLPDAFLREQAIVARDPKGSGKWYPVSWRDAREIEAGYPASPPAGNGYPEGGPVIQDGAEGLWIRNEARWAGGRFTQKLVPQGTPFDKWHWRPVGVDAAGHLWVSNGGADSGYEFFFRKTGGPPVRARNPQVVRGRQVVFDWDSEPHVLGMIFRGSPEADWELSRPGQAAVWNETRPGPRKLRLELRAMDSVGGLGALAQLPVDVDVRLPRTRWTSKELPAELSDILWRPPVAAEWAFQDVPRRIEFRVDKGAWQPLLEGGYVPLLEHNGKSVQIALRAVEEGAFADPDPRALAVRVRFTIDDAIARRIRVIMSGGAADRARAAEDLKLVRQQALHALPAKIEEVRRNLQTATPDGRKELEPILQQLEQALAIVQGQ